MKLKKQILQLGKHEMESKNGKEDGKRISRLGVAPAWLLAAALLSCCAGCSAKTPGNATQPATSMLSEKPMEDGESAAEPAQSTVTGSSLSDVDGFSDDGNDFLLYSLGYDLSDIPAFSGDPYVAVNDNVPEFEEADLTSASYESYSCLDSLGRCGVARACIGTDLMPTQARGSISQVKPTGWHSVRYDSVDGGSLYNRCHLIGYQLTAENANELNLITGTRYLNTEGMLPFENMVADYIKETGNHVLYRVTPVFKGDNLVANGVLMEGESVEDKGDSILFCVYCYNVQPGIDIDYASGDSWPDPAAGTGTRQDSSHDDNVATYILNTNAHKFHDPSCPSVGKMSSKNKQEFTGTRDEVIGMGYEPCGNCKP